MTRTVRDNAVTERLRAWIDDNYVGWGRFSRLEKDSQIRAHRWRDLCGGRQFAAPDMLDFVRRVSSEDADWIVAAIPPITIKKDSILESLGGADRSLVIIALQALLRERGAASDAARVAFDMSGRKPSSEDIFGLNEVAEALCRLGVKCECARSEENL